LYSEGLTKDQVKLVSEKCSKKVEEDDDDTDHIKICPMPRCRPAKRGCKYIKDGEKKKDGCPKRPCGKLICKSSCPVQKPATCRKDQSSKSVKYKFQGMTCSKVVCVKRNRCPRQSVKCSKGYKYKSVKYTFKGMKCSKLICVTKEEGDHDDTLCPMPRCLPAKDGCQYVENDEKKKNGCPKHPCGKLVCKEEEDREEEDHEEEDHEEEDHEEEDHEEDGHEEEHHEEEHHEEEHHEEEHEVDKCAVMHCAYGCANGKCNDKPQEEIEVDDDLPCKNVKCALALCQPGQTTVPANPSEGKCCNSCKGEPDLSYKCDHTVCAMAICKPGQTTVFAEPKKGKCCNSCAGKPDDTLEDGPETLPTDDDEMDGELKKACEHLKEMMKEHPGATKNEIVQYLYSEGLTKDQVKLVSEKCSKKVEEDNYKIVGGNVYCLAPSKDDYIDHQHAEDVADHHHGEDVTDDHHHGEEHIAVGEEHIADKPREEHVSYHGEEHVADKHPDMHINQYRL
jgi:hypothetical protein